MTSDDDNVRRRAGKSCGIAVMAKASIPARAKTRLVPPLTFEEAAKFNTAFLQDVATNIAAAHGQGRGVAVQGYMAYGPAGASDFFADILPSTNRFEAWHPNFGDCLYAAIERLLADGHTGAVVLNSDSPTLPTALLVEAVQVLARPGDRAVLGPSTDGGYYLLGLKAAHRRLFDDIAWSTDVVAQQTLERAAEIGLDVHTLPAWYDVDDASSLRLLNTELCDGVSFASGLTPHHAPQTRRLLAMLSAGGDFAQRLGIADPSLQSAAE